MSFESANHQSAILALQQKTFLLRYWIGDTAAALQRMITNATDYAGIL